MENYSDFSSEPVDLKFTMETEELIKLVDGIYKNILEKFNPGARQMINAGKAYLKALHGAAAASRLYVDAIAKLAKQAQQGTWGGSSDIGTALVRIVEVYKDIQEQQMNILKAFYVDLLVPLETNLEKDTKVVQSEQKKFLQQHKQRSETYSKAAATMKKQRKKSRGSSKSGIAMDKELKNMQVLEEEKTKLDAFCEQSLKTAMTQERRRYGFVLERQCSLAKHYLSYHNHGVNIYQQNIDEWDEVAKTREFLPEPVENMFTNRLRQVTFWPDEDVYSSPRSPQLDDDRTSISSQLRKTKSMDASCLDMRSIGDAASPILPLSRAKSEFNLTNSSPSLQDVSSPRRPKSLAAWDIPLAKALYAYLSSGENQLSFLEGDMIALMGERTKGWQFGENLRTHCSGWFPLAYTEVIDDPTIVGFSSPTHRSDSTSNSSGSGGGNQTPTVASTPGPQGGGQQRAADNGNTQQREQSHSLDASQPHRMFGDTLHLHRGSAKQIRRVTSNNNYIPPPALPAPVPTPQVPFQKPTVLTQSQSTTFTSPTYPSLTSFPPSFAQQPAAGLKTSTSSFSFTTSQGSGYSTHPQGTRPPPMPPLPLHLQGKTKAGVGVGNVSLHSSNDSGFSNDPPPQPEVDYSDDESQGLNKVPMRVPRHLKNDPNNNRKLPAVRHSSHSNLMSSQPNLRGDPNGTLRSITRDHETDHERKGIIKRTKSFWKFRRSNSEEILEGMAMWKHRDLVDIIEKEKKAAKKVVELKRSSPPKPQERTFNKTGTERSNDSDRTMLAKYEDHEEEIYGARTVEPPKRRTPSFKAQTQKLSLPIRSPEPRHQNEIERTDDTFEKREKRTRVEDEFYDDEGDGLMRTVNRKSILQQYADSNVDSNTGSDSEADTTLSDDPYDCIVVDDHTTSTTTTKQKKRNGRNEIRKSNVAEIGKKLEKLSKSSKYNPESKDKQHAGEYRNSVNKLTAYNNDKNLEISTICESENTEEEIKVRRYNGARNSQPVRSPSPAQRHSFKTFGRDEDDFENEQTESNSEIERETFVKPRKKYHEKEKEKRHYCRDRRDEYEDESEKRQFLPRTKLVKSSTMQAVMKFEQEIIDYEDETRNKMKRADDEEIPNHGNVYGPWYDLWGLDSTSKK